MSISQEGNIRNVNCVQWPLLWNGDLSNHIRNNQDIKQRTCHYFNNNVECLFTKLDAINCIKKLLFVKITKYVQEKNVNSDMNNMQIILQGQSVSLVLGILFYQYWQYIIQKIVTKQLNLIIHEWLVPAKVNYTVQILLATYLVFKIGRRAGGCYYCIFFLCHINKWINHKNVTYIRDMSSNKRTDRQIN